MQDVTIGWPGRRVPERLGEMDFRLVTGGPGLEKVIRDYESVYAASWKEPEVGAAFIRDLVKTVADADALRCHVLKEKGFLFKGFGGGKSISW